MAIRAIPQRHHVDRQRSPAATASGKQGQRGDHRHQFGFAGVFVENKDVIGLTMRLLDQAVGTPARRFAEHGNRGGEQQSGKSDDNEGGLPSDQPQPAGWKGLIPSLADRRSEEQRKPCAQVHARGIDRERACPPIAGEIVGNQ